MASVNARNGRLFFDLRVCGQRCREYTKLSDTPANRRKMERALDKIQAEITLGQFDYESWFPGSKNAIKVANATPAELTPSSNRSTPLFKEFVEDWLAETEITWRRSHASTIRSTLDRHLIPAFGDREIGQITKQDILKFRVSLARIPGRNGNASLAPKTINRTIQLLGQILAEAADRFDCDNPAAKIKRLKQPKVDIQPFSMEEVRLLLETVRADYKPYLTVRLFTGMRTAEIHGLKWRYVDFERRQILIRETLVRGAIDYTKTDGSQREIHMSQPVYEALKEQHQITGRNSEWVFCTRNGEPLDVDNVTNRIWYPLLRLLHLDPRRPYQMRHTAATLWLAAGENPEWVARQLGHSNTQMLFRTYSRFIPNLTRRDGSAFDSLIRSAMNHGVEEVKNEH